MRVSYIKALEMRARWLQSGREEFSREHVVVPDVVPNIGTPAWRDYLFLKALEHGPSYYMNKNFCLLVDHARQSVPNDIEFDDKWMLSESGFLWLETPFHVPAPKDFQEFPIPQQRATDAWLKAKGDFEFRIQAIGWQRVVMQESGQLGWHFMCYQKNGDIFVDDLDGWTGWSDFSIVPGDKMIEKIRWFDPHVNAYADTGELELLHEIRWIYSAFHLMAQKLTHVSAEKTSAMARFDARRKRLQINPELKIVSLRRMEQDRPKEKPGELKNVDWQWQWLVQGHWRLQPYQTIGDYRWIFIESYVKGPENKPFKPASEIIYKAVK